METKKKQSFYECIVRLAIGSHRRRVTISICQTVYSTSVFLAQLYESRVFVKQLIQSLSKPHRRRFAPCITQNETHQSITTEQRQYDSTFHLLRTRIPIHMIHYRDDLIGENKNRGSVNNCAKKRSDEKKSKKNSLHPIVRESRNNRSISASILALSIVLSTHE